MVETLRDLLIGDQARLRQFAPGIPFEALRELVVNAYMHRCWRTNGPVMITVADGGIEIVNPGDLLPGLHVDSLIHCVPVYRNLLLAESLRYCGLADKIGQGIRHCLPVVDLRRAGFSLVRKPKQHVPSATCAE